MHILDDYPDLLTVKEVADILRVDKSYVYRLIRKGTLPALHPGPHKTRVARTDLQHFLTSTYSGKKAGYKE